MRPLFHSPLQLASGLARLLNHDFCPGVNHWFKWLKHPTVPLIAAAGAALVCSLFVNPSACLLAVALLLVLLFGVGWPWIALCGLNAELRFEDLRATEREPTAVRLKIVNRAPWPIWGLTLDRGFRRFGTERTTWALAKVAGWSTSEFRFEFTPDSRGEFPCEPALLRTSFPFGLWYSQRSVVVQTPLLVWPQTIPLQSIPDVADLRDSQNQLSPRRIGETGDLMGTRLFRQGDSLRRVHWAQTARQGKLIVCERQASAQSAVLVELDTNQEMHSTPGPDGTLEWSIRAAASICLCFREQHASVECRIGGELHVWPVGESGRRRLLDHFARLPFEGSALTPTTSGSGRSRLLQYVCTTPRGMRSRHVVGRGGSIRFVTVDSVRNEEGAGPAQSGAAIELIAAAEGTGETPANQLRRQWERSCHDLVH